MEYNENIIQNNTNKVRELISFYCDDSDRKCRESERKLTKKSLSLCLAWQNRKFS